jgi:hypothetical protein
MIDLALAALATAGALETLRSHRHLDGGWGRQRVGGPSGPKVELLGVLRRATSPTAATQSRAG